MTGEPAVPIPDEELNPVVIIADEARRHADRGGWPLHCKCGESTFDLGDHVAGRVMDRLVRAGYAIIAPAELRRRVDYDSHDLGEFGKVIRLEYLDQALADQLRGRNTTDPAPAPGRPVTEG